MARHNIGRHLIISDEVHTSFRAECAKAEVRMTDVADTIIKDFLTNLNKVDDACKVDALKELAAQRVRPKRAEPMIPTSEKLAVGLGPIMVDGEEVVTDKAPQGGDSNVAPQEANPEGQAKPQ